MNTEITIKKQDLEYQENSEEVFQIVLQEERCGICGKITRFKIKKNAVLLREAVCEHCGASLRNSDTAKQIVFSFTGKKTISLREFASQSSLRILNTCSSGYIHEALKSADGYVASEYFQDIPGGEWKNGVVCVDLQEIPFENNSFDLVISEDVFEHIHDYQKAFAEIYRILKPQGHHIFTVPIHEGKNTVSRKDNPRIIYHGDPLREHGCVVVTDFGDDIITQMDELGFCSKLIRSHCFYSPEQITDCDADYDEYLQKKDKMDEYFKYNSLVIDSCKKPESRQKDIQNGGRSMPGENSRSVFTGERFVPGIDDLQLELEHFQRYYSILPLVNNKLVLDAACGEGYGSSIIAYAAKKVTGIDIDRDAITRAEERYSIPGKIDFLQQSVEKLSFPDKCMDVVVSFETIEHLPEEIQLHFLSEAARVLKEDGILVMSTPNKEIYSDLYNYQNEFHIKEFYKNEFRDFLKKKFQNISLYNQYFETVSIIDSCERRGDQKAVYRKDQEYQRNGKYFIAVAGNTELPAEDITHIYMNKFPQNETNILRILQLQDEVEERNHHLKKLDTEIENDRKIIEQQENTIQECRKDLTNSQAILEEMKLKIEAREQEITDQKQTILNKEGHIRQLLEVEREYEREKNSRAYRLVQWFRIVSSLLVPSGSKRRKILKKLVCVIKKK